MMRTSLFTLLAVFGVFSTALAGDYIIPGEDKVPLGIVPEQNDDLEFIFQLNGWGPWVELTTARGTEIDLGLDKIVKNLRGLYEFGAGVQMGKWSFYSDVLYADVKKNGYSQFINKVNIKEWLVTPKIGYRAFEGDWGQVDLQAGLRYTWIDFDITGAGPLGRQFDEDVDGEIYDAVGGFSGHYNLNDRWFLPFMLEAGAGDSDFVFSAFGGVGYRYKNADVLFGFKYLSYEFADDAPAQDEKIYGPRFSLRFTF